MRSDGAERPPGFVTTHRTTVKHSGATRACKSAIRRPKTTHTCTPAKHLVPAPLCPSLTAPRPLSMVPACGMLCRIGTDKAALPRSSSCPIGSNRMGLRLSRRLSRLDLASISPQSRLNLASSRTASPTRASRSSRSGDTWMTKLTTTRATPG